MSDANRAPSFEEVLDAMRGGFKKTRKRGMYRAYQPEPPTRRLFGQVQEILHEYREHLPMTVRQVFYRLVGAYGYPKDANAAERLGEALQRGRRAGLIPFEALRDDGGTIAAPACYGGKPDFWLVTLNEARAYQLPRLTGQRAVVELWCEAAGMVPQLARIANPLGVSVYSSGGFDSVTEHHNAAKRIVQRERPTLVLHVGDHDPSGVSLFNAMAEDVTQFVSDLGGKDGHVTIRRVAVLPEQITRYGLPESPPKKSDKRGVWLGGTAQAEALNPEQLAHEVRQALEREIDDGILGQVLEVEAAEREALVKVTKLLSTEGR